MVDVKNVSWLSYDLACDYVPKVAVPLSEDQYSAVPTTSVRHQNREGPGGEWRKEALSIRH